MTERDLISKGGAVGRGGPEPGPWHLVLAVRTPVLVQVVGEAVQRPSAGDASLLGGRLVIGFRETGTGRVGHGRAGRGDTGQRSADTLARDGGVVPGLLQHVLPILAQDVP